MKLSCLLYETHYHPPPSFSTSLSQQKPWWRSWETWQRLLVTGFMWVTATASFWSVNLSASDLLPGNRYLNLVILGLMHFPSIILGIIFGRFCTRKVTLFFFFLGGGFSFGASFLSQLVGGLNADHDAVFWLTILGTVKKKMC